MLTSKYNISIFVMSVTAFSWGIAAIVPPAAGQSSDQRAVRVLEKIRQHYEQSIRNIDDYAVVTDSYTVYYQKVMDNDRPYFKARIQEDDPGRMQTASSVSHADLFKPEIYERIKDQAQYAGREVFDDYRALILRVEEIEGLFEASEDMPARLEDIKLYVDADNWILRRMDFSTEAELERTRKVNVDVVTELSDFRDVEGMQIPYKTVTKVSGISGMLSEAQRRQAAEGLRELETQLEQMPPQQRQMVEQMMRGQLQQYRKILESDTMEIVQRIREVRVNTGLPENE